MHRVPAPPTRRPRHPPRLVPPLGGVHAHRRRALHRPRPARRDGGSRARGVRPARRPPRGLTPMVQLVYDPQDSRDCMRRLAALHSLGGGCVVCRPPPGPGTRGVTAALLRALGKQLRRRETPHDPRRQLHYAAIWLAADQVTDLVVIRADRLAPAAW